MFIAALFVIQNEIKKITPRGACFLIGNANIKYGYSME